MKVAAEATGQTSFSRKELIELVGDKIPAELIKKAFGDPTNKDAARDLTAAFSLYHLTEMFARTYCDGRFVPRFAAMLSGATRSYSESVGNLREREVPVPEHPVDAFLTAMGEKDENRALELVPEIPRLVEKQLAKNGKSRPRKKPTR